MQGKKSRRTPPLINYTTDRSKSQAKAGLTNKRKKEKQATNKRSNTKKPLKTRYKRKKQREKANSIKRN